MRRYNLSERELNRLVSRIIKEEDSETKRKKEVKPRCVPENVMPLDEIVGRAEEFGRYSPGITKRQSGVNSMVDTLGILNNIRLFKDVKDGGSHLAYEMMNNLNRFRNKNYHDETTGECHKAMDKIIKFVNMDISQKILSDITVYMKYAKFVPELNRRETWEELVTRNKEMHQKKYPHIKDEIENVYKLVYDKKILPSMRSLQFGIHCYNIQSN